MTGGGEAETGVSSLLVSRSRTPLSLSRLFPLWAALAAVAAYLAPDSFRPLLPWVTDLLTLVMFGLGVTLTFADFRRVITRPAPVIAGVVVHYLVMPLAAWLIARALHMPPELTTGMILVGSVASGTGSTLMVFLAGGDVALSITIAAMSTLVGIVATPLLVRFYVDASVPVDVVGLLKSIVQIVALPVGLGLAAEPGRAAPRASLRARPALRVDGRHPAHHRRRGGGQPGQHRHAWARW